MIKQITLIILIMILGSTLVSVFAEVSGVLNDKNVRIRKSPVLEDNIIGSLDKNTKVTILGRSNYHRKIGTMNAYWLEVEAGDLTGWVYGYFINTENSPYRNLPISDLGIFSKSEDYSRAKIGDSYMDNLEENKLKYLEEKKLNYKEIQEELYNKLRNDNNVAVSFFSNERLLILNRVYWVNDSIIDLYTSFRDQIEKKQPIFQLLPPTVGVGIMETGRYFFMDSIELSEFIQVNYHRGIHISELKVLDDGAVFWISNTDSEFYPTTINSESIVFYIQKIGDSIFPDLQNTHEIASITIAPFSLKSIEEENSRALNNLINRDYNRLDETKLIMYGVQEPLNNK